MIQLYWLQLYCYNNAKTLCRIQKRATVSRYATKSPPYLRDMMHYRPLPIRHLGGRVPPSPAGFTPLQIVLITSVVIVTMHAAGLLLPQSYAGF